MDPNWERLGRLPPEKKVAVMMDMTSSAVRICADGMRSQSPGLTGQELIERVRERLEWSKRGRVQRTC